MNQIDYWGHVGSFVQNPRVEIKAAKEEQKLLRIRLGVSNRE
jgi:hypothetical protein